MFVDSKDVSEYTVGQFEADASMLGLPPGRVPRSLETNMGNGRPFELTEMKRQGNEVYAFVYLQGNGCITLTVWND